MLRTHPAQTMHLRGRGGVYVTQVSTRNVVSLFSPVLANMALDGLESLLQKRYPRRKGMKVHLVRYANDFIITCSDRQLFEQEIRPQVEAFLAARVYDCHQKRRSSSTSMMALTFLASPSLSSRAN